MNQLECAEHGHEFDAPAFRDAVERELRRTVAPAKRDAAYDGAPPDRDAPHRPARGLRSRTAHIAVRRAQRDAALDVARGTRVGRAPFCLASGHARRRRGSKCGDRNALMRGSTSRHLTDAYP
jgi:hypothetical protein